MTCSWASRLISPVVDDSDDKTTTFTLLLFNFYLFPQALLSITDFSQPLSVFLSVHLSFPFSSPLLSSPGAFCLFIPPCHELTTFFLSHCVFYMSLHFSSLFVPSQFPRGLLSLSLSVLWNQYFSICVHSSLSFFTLQHSLSVSSSLSLLVSASPLFYLRSWLPVVWYTSCSSSHPHKSVLVLFYVFSSSGWASFRFRCSHFFLLAAALMQRQVCLICLFKSLVLFLHSAKRHYQALRKVRKRDGADLLQSRDRDK